MPINFKSEGAESFFADPANKLYANLLEEQTEHAKEAFSKGGIHEGKAYVGVILEDGKDSGTPDRLRPLNTAGLHLAMFCGGHNSPDHITLLIHVCRSLEEAGAAAALLLQCLEPSQPKIDYGLPFVFTA